MGMILNPDPKPNSSSDSSINDSSENHSQSFTSISTSSFDILIAEFTARWNRGESPRVEEYLARLDKEHPSQAVELAYHEFRLAENDGLDPDINDYLIRFPDQADGIFELYSLYKALRSNSLRLSGESLDHMDLLPEVNNEIGPYRLIADLGRGAFAKVFLAEQTNLDDRLVVVKVSTRVTEEPLLLARASHPNIVEVLTTTMVNGDAFQMIVMRFLGGTTLSALLSERRKSGSKPGSGADLLADVDRIQPKGYPAATSQRPARQILSAMSYPKAIGWTIARLAEALNHAYSRGVLHGDVKPSNILITADGNPMLLDFNLSVGWTIDPAGPHGRNLAEDPGGTLAYMAPERLRSVAEGGGGQAEPVKQPKAVDRHRADIYSLGVVLLQALTGKTPDIPSAGKAVSPRELASAYFSSRLHDGKVMIRSARGTNLPADLKAILRHCLAPDPADRYKDAGELAEDLDRWNSDRPLLFARKPKGLPALQRWARRNRVLVGFVAVALIAIAAATFVTYQISRDASMRHASRFYVEIVNSGTAGPLHLRRVGSTDVRGDENATDASRELLERYKVIDDPDWRSRDEVRFLPAELREELDALLLEQSLRLAYDLAQRPEGGNGSRRFWAFFTRVLNTTNYPALALEIQELGRKWKNGRGVSDEASDFTQEPRSPWIAEYLEGVAREIRGDNKGALGHFRNALKLRTQSFWANYRASANAFTLIPVDGSEASGIAARCLKVCVSQFPDNAILRHQYATCLLMNEQPREALAEYDNALKINPENAETFLARAFLRLKLGQISEFVEDIKHYENLIQFKAPRQDNESLDAFDGDESIQSKVDGRKRFAKDDRSEAMVRTALGELLWRGRHYAESLEQFDRALAINPESVRIRHGRAMQLLRLKDPRADEEIASLANDDRFATFTLRFQPQGVYFYAHRVKKLITEGKGGEAVKIGRNGARVADQTKTGESQMHFLLASALALDAKIHPEQFDAAVNELQVSYRLDSKAFFTWISQEPLFLDDRFDFGKLSKEAEATLRGALGEQLWRKKEHEAALKQFDLSLAIDPTSIRFRYGKAIQQQALGREEGKVAYDALVRDPDFEAFTLNMQPDALHVYQQSASRHLGLRNAKEALLAAEKAVSIAEKLNKPTAEMHSILASAFVLASKDDPAHIDNALVELRRAYRLDALTTNRFVAVEPLLRDMASRMPEWKSTNP